MEIRIARNGQEYGPYPRETVVSFLTQGQLTLQDLAWTSDSKQWEPLTFIVLRHWWKHQIYIGRDQQTHGPYSPSALEEYLRSGHVTLADQAWISHQNSWQPLAKLIAQHMGDSL